MFENLRADINRYRARIKHGPLKTAILLAFTPGVQATLVFRFSCWCNTKNRAIKIITSPFRFPMRTLMIIIWGIDIPAAAHIGPGLYIGHFGEIIVSPKAVLGKNVSLSQGVTIGVSGRDAKRGAPTIGDNVYIAPGAKVFGKIKIGDNCEIGANAVIHRDIPANSTAVLSPGFQLIEKS